MEENKPKKFEDLTKEQQEQIKKLTKQYTFKNLKRTGIMLLNILLANLIILIIDALYVHNAIFAFVSAFMSTLLIMPHFSSQAIEESKKLSEEVKKVISN